MASAPFSKLCVARGTEECTENNVGRNKSALCLQLIDTDRRGEETKHGEERERDKRKRERMYVSWRKRDSELTPPAVDDGSGTYEQPS